MLSTEPKSKFMDVIVIYPCRVVPFDKTTADEKQYGDEVRVEREVGEDLIGMKRAVEVKEFSKKKYPFPANKLRAGGDGEEKEPAKPPAKSPA